MTYGIDTNQNIADLDRIALGELFEAACAAQNKAYVAKDKAAEAELEAFIVEIEETLGC